MSLGISNPGAPYTTAIRVALDSHAGSNLMESRAVAWRATPVLARREKQP